jgi:hypothetical protein
LPEATVWRLMRGEAATARAKTNARIAEGCIFGMGVVWKVLVEVEKIVSCGKIKTVGEYGNAKVRADSGSKKM